MLTLVFLCVCAHKFGSLMYNHNLVKLSSFFGHVRHDTFVDYQLTKHNLCSFTVHPEVEARNSISLPSFCPIQVSFASWVWIPIFFQFRYPWAFVHGTLPQKNMIAIWNHHILKCNISLVPHKNLIAYYCEISCYKLVSL